MIMKWRKIGLLLPVFCICCGSNAQTNSAQLIIEQVKTSAETGNVAAQCALGEIYEKGGLGVTKDMAQAVKWYQKAANQGNPEAECNLGLSFYKGEGVAKDYSQGFNWLQKAAEQGSRGGEYNLGAMYYNGDGVPKNYVEAYKWNSLAAAQGDEDAQKWLSILEEKMTAEQIAEAQRLAAAFVPRKETPNSNSNLGLPVAVGSPIAAGTGFFITDDGYLISNYHVVKDAAQVRLVTSTGTILAKVVQVDAANDLALLKADGHFACLPVISSLAVKLGGTVATVGFPDPGLQGFSPKLAKGEIAALSGAGDDARYFQISAPVQPGNSGGALVDGAGNVVGIVSAKLDASAALAMSGSLPESVNYAVKSSFLLSFLESAPDVSAKLKAPNTKEEKFEDVVKSAQDAAVLVLVY